MFERLLNIVNAVDSPRVLVLGDYMLDSYIFGNTDRISPEAPVMVLNVTDRQRRPGGAGSVAVDLNALNSKVICCGLVGQDPAGEQLLKSLNDLDHVDTSGMIVDSQRPTTTKQRVIGLAQHRHQQQLMRIDEEDTQAVSDAVGQQILESLKNRLPECDVVCLQDYNKGLFCDSLGREVIALAGQAGKKVIVDPAAINDYSRYEGAWLVKPNRREITLATGIEAESENAWQKGCEHLCDLFRFENIVLTLDKQGAYLYSNRDKSGDHIPTRPRDVYDVTGAGDMMLATLGLLVGGTCEGLDPPTLNETVSLANIAGGLEVEQYGSIGISREEISADLILQGKIQTGKLRSLEALLNELPWHRRHDRKVAFTNGCFDILHSGHIELLKFARQQAGILVVAINSDASVKANKGPDRPINDQADRAILLGALEVVDYVVIFDEETPINLIKAISPDILIKGTDWVGNVVGQEWVEAHGGRVALMKLKEGRSTTGTIEKILGTNNE